MSLSVPLCLSVCVVFADSLFLCLLMLNFRYVHMDPQAMKAARVKFAKRILGKKIDLGVE